jgi:hypothetical protein
MRIEMANSEMNSDVLFCGSDYEDSFMHEMFNITIQKLDSPSDKVITRSSLPLTKNNIIKTTKQNVTIHFRIGHFYSHTTTCIDILSEYNTSC